MRIEAVECSHYGLKAFAPLIPSSIARSKSQNCNNTSRIHTVRRSLSSNLDGIYNNEPPFRVKGSAKSCGEEGGDCDKNKGRRGLRKKKLHIATSQESPFRETARRDSFMETRFDFLEPMMLGIKPEFPDWPDRETAVWATIEQKAKSLDIPLSLRMIKKKLQSEECTTFKDYDKDSSYCSVKAAFASMVFIVIELQSYALQMRGALCSDDLEIITSKVQKEMHSSFVWLFQQVFSRTPLLMLHVMMLLADFSVHSASHNMDDVRQIPPIESTSRVITSSEFSKATPQVEDPTLSEQDLSSVYHYDDNRLDDAVELELWDSMVDDALKLSSDEIINREAMRCLVSPVSVEIERDNYEDYHRTDLMYQMNLSYDPGNSLLLCNYAQFLHLVAKDYDRAEECFKQAVQATPPDDAEALSRYANFLWNVRGDLSGAEERFLQALALEPENSYYASRYANFLWSTGGEETCFPVNTESL